ncbi:MAG: iron-containing alcohol dehydrogenase [Calditerrivibrio sp.]|nr:iron-containing alcohol dehydrogenase [Calditerrivibrio sp.]MCA1980665.1 iron-containing alcohol dehydrogenase [Calditerrivibrio sp.]
MKTDFYFYSPVKVHVEVEPIKVISKFLRDIESVGVISGKKSIVKTGFKDFLINSFKDKDIFFFDEVEENPSINTIIKGGRFLRENRCKAVISFGGGSAIDAGKACAIFAENNIPFYELLASERYNLPLPVLAIPTTCGTGSEVNQYSIITDIEKRDKINFSKSDSFPKDALLFSEYLKSLDEKILIATVFDAFTHAFEGFIATSSNPFTDTLAMEVMKIIIKNLQNYIDGKFLNLPELHYASSVAGIVIGHTGTTLLHALGYYLTNHHKIHHGEANALLLPSFLTLCRKQNLEKLNLVDRIMKDFRLEIEDAVKSIFNNRLVDILSHDEFENMVDYALNKPNVLKTPFTVNRDYILDSLTLS